MSNKHQIVYSVGFKADKSGLETIRKSLQAISNIGVTEFKLETGKSIAELQKLKTAAEDVQDALTTAFDVNLNTLDLTTFTQEINRTQGSFNNLAITMNGAGRAGRAAFSDLLGTILTTQDAVKGTNKLLDSMAKTFFNTIKWSVSSSILNMFTGSIQQAWGYTQKLDQSLNDIRIVTEKSNAEMEKFAKTANKAAKSLGSSTTSYTNAALIYYQQGLGEKDVQARTRTTIKAANVTGQSAAEVSEQLTAVWNGYKVVAEEAESYVDKLAAVAATTAADLEELSTGMSKVASAANAMGVDVDQLSAQLATIVSVTRQDANVVGTALKTIFSRMGDLKVDGVDEFGVSLGDVSGQLEQMGINVLDQQGNLRDMGIVIEEVAAKWGSWTEAQQQAAAVAIAGKRQYNNLIALFENWDMYESALSTSQNAEGTLQKQQDIYMDSIEARLNKLKAASEGLFDSLIDSESAKSLIDILTLLVKGVDQLAQSVGGLGNILQMVGGIATKLFSAQISNGASQLYANYQIGKFNAAQAAAAGELGLGLNRDDLTDGQKKALDLKTEQIRLAKLLTDEEREHYDILIKQTLEQEKIKEEQEAELEAKKHEIELLKTQKLSGAAKTNATSRIRNLTVDKVSDEYEEMASDTRTAVANSVAAAAKATETGDNARRKGAINSLKNAKYLSSDAKDELEELDKEYQDVLTHIKNGTFDAATEQKIFNEYLEKAQGILLKHADNLDKSAQESKELAEETKKLNSAEKAREQDMARMAKVAHFKEIANQVTSLIGSLTMLASAYSVVANAANIWNDEALSTKEKIGQMIPIILSVVGMLWGTVAPAIEMLKQKGIEAQLSFGWISAIMIIVTAAVALVAGLVMAFRKDTPTAAEIAQKRFERLTETLSSMNNTLKDAQQRLRDLKDEMADYREARKGIDELRAGTEEWKDAIDVLNLKVLELIEKYPQLELIENSLYGRTLYEIDSNSIDDAIRSQKDIIDAIEFGVATTTFQSRIAQRDRAQAEFDKQIKNKTLDYQQYALRDYSVRTNSKVDAQKEADRVAEIFRTLFGENNITTSSILESVSGIYDIRVGFADSGSEDAMRYLAEKSLSSYEDLIKAIDESNALSVLEKEEYKKLIQSFNTLNQTVAQTNSILSETELDILERFAVENSLDKNVFLNLAKLNNNTSSEFQIEGKEGIVTTGGLDDLINNNKDFQLREIATYVDKEGNVKATLTKQDGKWTADVSNQVGYNLETEIQAEEQAGVKTWIDKQVALAFNGKYKVTDYGTLVGLKTSELTKHKIKVAGQEMTISELSAMAWSKVQEQVILQNHEGLVDLMKQNAAQGRIAEAAYFNDDYFGTADTAAEDAAKRWTDGTIAGYDTIISYGEDVGKNAEQSKKFFQDELGRYLSNAGLLTFDSATGKYVRRKSLIEAYAEDGETLLPKFNLLTGEETQALAASIFNAEATKAGGGQALANLINSIDDPVQMKKIQGLLKNSNWDSTEWVTNFETELTKLGIIFEDKDWKDFLNDINSGMRRWVEDSEKVRKNLSFIKNSLEDLQVGDVISDDEYQQVLSIDPDLANNFIKTPDGYMAVNNGKSIASEARNVYTDLTGLKAEYAQTSASVETVKQQGVYAGLADGRDEKAEIISYFGFTPSYDENGTLVGATLTNAERRNAILNLLGVNAESFEAFKYLLFNGNPSEQEQAREKLTNWMNQTDSLLTRHAAGEFSDTSATDVILTSGISASKAVEEFNKDQKSFDGLNQKNLTVLAKNFLEEIAEIGEQYREFLISEQEFWKVEMKGMSDLTTQSLLSEAAIQDKFDLIATQANATTDLFDETVTGLEALNSKMAPELVLETYQAAQEYLLDYKQAIQSLEELWIDALEQLNNLYDEQIERFKNFHSILNSSADLMKLIGKNFDIIQTYYTSMVTNAERTYQGTLKKFNQAKLIYDDIMNRDRAAVSDEEYNEAVKNYENVTQELIAVSKEWVEIIKTAFSEQVSVALEDAIKASTGYEREAMSMAWELEVAKDDRYLDEVNKIYAIESLERKIQKSIDETDNVSIQRKLNELKERELKILEEKSKLSQYDLDRANAEYELTLKQIALEEAQQTANKMKLTRDAMGNYTYQYVADQDAISQAEEALATAKNNLYNLDKDRKKELISEWFSIMSEYESKMSKAMATGNTELQEQIQDYYFGEEGILAAIQSELELMGLGDIFKNTTDRILNIKITGEDGLEGALTNIVEETRGAMQDATTSIQELFSMNGSLAVSIDDFEKGVETAVSVLDNLSNSNETGAADILVKNLSNLANKINEYTTTLTESLQKLLPYKDLANTSMEDSNNELKENTSAIELLTLVMQDLSDTAGLNGKAGDTVIQNNNWKFDENSGTWIQASEDTGKQ